MSIDWEAFTPYSGLMGGGLIGLAAAALMLLNGRVAGISGILGGLLRDGWRRLDWRCWFLCGMLLAALLLRVGGKIPPISIDTQWPLLLVGGVLVGAGTHLANGCTSGHGICGLARFSKRSLAATLVFMISGMVTVYASGYL